MSIQRIEHIVGFVAVAEAGSLTAAARRLGLSKSVVSRRLSDLEDSLGVRLVNRSTRRLGLTEAGLQFHERCRRILAELDAAAEEAAAGTADLAGTLRVAAPMSFGTQHLAPAVVAFLVAHPRVDITLDLDDRQHDLVQEGIDVAVRIGRLADSALVARRLTSMRLITCASPAYLESAGRPDHPRDLAGHRCVVYSNVAAGAEWQFQIDGAPRSVRVGGPLRVNNGELLMCAARAGLGIARVPSFLAAPLLRTGELVPLLEAYQLAPIGVHAVYPGHRHLASKTRAFIDFLAQRFADPPPWDDGGS